MNLSFRLPLPAYSHLNQQHFLLPFLLLFHLLFEFEQFNPLFWVSQFHLNVVFTDKVKHSLFKFVTAGDFNTTMMLLIRG